MKKLTLSCNNEQEALRGVHVRLITPQEEKQFNTIIEEEHYLRHARMAGNTLRYVAELDEQWVALIGWGASAYHLRDRDEWIGWSRQTRRSRLNLVVGNNRFLLRTQRGEVPNLASRVLSLCLKRLPDDWEKQYGYRPLLAETFVDIEQYAGTCYKASNWIELGHTAGFAKARADYYEAHHRPKRLYVRELTLDAREQLCTEELPAS